MTILAGRRRDAPTILDRLRDETRTAHERIERQLDWQRRLASPDGYRRLLARFHGFHAVWEPAAAELIADDALLKPRRKLHLLTRDLHRLGLTPRRIEALPRAPDVPLRNRAEALGSLYVMEGSTLGGQVIARHVARTLGFAGTEGRAYYLAYGDRTGAMWRALRAYLLAEQLSAAGAEDMVGAAVRTFEQLGSWLTDSGCPRPRSAAAEQAPIPA